MIDIVIMQPEESGNVGAIARSMANFGFSNLILVEPFCKIDEKAKCRAKHAQQILDKAKIVDKSYLKKYDVVVGTTSKLGGRYNVPRGCLTSKEFGEKLKTITNLKKRKMALLFGREGVGLTNKEVLECDMIVTIPSHKKYAALNLSHAVSIMLYEVFQAIGDTDNKIGSKIDPSTKKDLEIVDMRMNQVLDKLDFSTKEKKETQKIVWKKVFAKAMMNKREAFAVIGFFKKILDKLK